MATGWAGDGAVQDQIDATVEDAIKRARSKLPSGPGLEHCEECDARIPDARRKAMPGVRLCVPCHRRRTLSGTGWMKMTALPPPTNCKRVWLPSENAVAPPAA